MTATSMNNYGTVTAAQPFAAIRIAYEHEYGTRTLPQIVMWQVGQTQRMLEVSEVVSTILVWSD